MMKKVILTVALFAGFGFAVSAQCPLNYSPITSSCWSGCVAVNTWYGNREPTANELFAALNHLEARCAAKPIVATTIDPN